MLDERQRGSYQKTLQTERRTTMAGYKIKDIEGIGPAYAEKLSKAGIDTTSSLLEQGCTPQGRKSLAEKTGINESTILKWTNMADLFRVKGIGSEYSELLEKSGVDTVKELRNRNPENLHAKMEAVNSAGRALVRKLPSKSQVEKWIQEAKKTEPKMTY
jgi:predicted flap endonuclease-1-like 5' DNA nuclease